MKKYQFLSGATLKHIALFSMFIDHFNKAIMFPLTGDNSPQWLHTLQDIFGIIGRFAFPLFCFLIVEGFCHTKSKAKYLIGMLVFAVISEIPFNLNITQEFFNTANTAAQNIFFTWAIAIGTIWIVDEIRKKTTKWPVFAVLITLVGAAAASFSAVDYGAYGVLVTMAFYAFRSKRVLASCVGYACIFKEFWAIPSFIAVNFYNGKRGKQYKWLNYWFYPAHLLVLGLVSKYVMW